MSLGAVVQTSNRRKPSDGQFVSDLAGLFERRRIDLGEPHVCEQLEILLTTSDAFRSQLFTLCIAISHMSERDLTGEELLGFVGRALRTESVSQSLRDSFLSGFETWNKRSVNGEDEWPPRKKPVASAPANSAYSAPADSAHAEPQVAPQEPAAPARPGGLPTVQEALELARVRGGNRPLRPEIVPAAAQAPPERVPEPSIEPASNSAAIDELATLLHQIEDRMSRLRPHLVPGPSPTSEPPAQAQTFERPAVDIFKSGEDTPDTLLSEPYQRALDILNSGPRPLVRPESAIFLPQLPASMEPQDGRDSYLRNTRRRPMIDAIEAAPAREVEKPAAPPPAADTELRLMPRTAALDEVEPPKKSGPPVVVLPDTVKLKTYIAIAVLAALILLGAPLAGVVVYRYMHPLYIYQTQPQPAPAAPAQSAGDAKPGSQDSAAPAKSKPRRKAQHGNPKPPVQVWPFPEQ